MTTSRADWPKHTPRAGDADAITTLRCEDSILGANLRGATVFDRELILAREVLRLRDDTAIIEACREAFAKQLAAMVEATPPPEQGVLIRAIEKHFK